jgi:hypothetical protein
VSTRPPTAPFPTEDKAAEHLSDNHANPGGWSRSLYQAGFEPDEVLARLIDEADGPATDPWRHS